MVKIDLITGFLGAGKTTFLLKYARHFLNCGERIGILEYDYGAVNVDMLLVGALRGENCELEMLAAACDADSLKRRFRTKLIAMAMSGYDRVIIEPSGVFDMDVFFDSLREEPLDAWYEIGSVITVVDATTPDNLGAESDYYLASQAAGAGQIVLSKVQLSSDEQIVHIKEHIHRAAEAIGCLDFKPRYLEKEWDHLGAEDFEALSRSGYHGNDYVKVIAGKDSTFSTVCYLEPKFGLDDAGKIVKELFADASYGDVRRVKGFLTDEGTNYEINATGETFEIKKSRGGQQVLIVIGANLNRDAVTKRLASPDEN